MKKFLTEKQKNSFLLLIYKGIRERTSVIGVFGFFFLGWVKGPCLPTRVKLNK